MGYSLEEMFFALLRSEVCGTELSSDIKNQITSEKLPAVYKLSKLHDLAHLTGNALEKNGLMGEDSLMYEPFFKARNMAIYRYETSNYELGEICRILEQEKIKHIPLKGAIIRDYYPEPWMRTSCDLDILISKKDIPKAKEILKKELKYDYKSAWNYELSFFAPSGMHIELHYFLDSDREKEKKVLDDVWNRVFVHETDMYHKSMSDTMYYFYHLSHMAKHVEVGGCGVRPFLDVWILNHKIDFDRDKRYELLKQGGLLKFAKAVEELAEFWFSESECKYEKEEFAEYIIAGGMYGSMQNRVIFQQSKKGGKVRYIFSRVFLSYKELCLTYPNLKKHKILTPFYQVKRWFRLLFKGKMKKAVSELNVSAKISEEAQLKAEKLLNDLGLKE